MIHSTHPCHRALFMLPYANNRPTKQTNTTVCLPPQKNKKRIQKQKQKQRGNKSNQPRSGLLTTQCTPSNRCRSSPPDRLNWCCSPPPPSPRDVSPESDKSSTLTHHLHVRRLRSFFTRTSGVPAPRWSEFCGRSGRSGAGGMAGATEGMSGEFVLTFCAS